MAKKIIIEDQLFECPACGYRWTNECDLSFDETKEVPCCPDCGELIEDGKSNVNYLQLFIDKWREICPSLPSDTKEILMCWREHPEYVPCIYDKNSFSKFFTSPEILVGFYFFQGGGWLYDAGWLFYSDYDEYLTYSEDCRKIIEQAKDIFDALDNAHIENFCYE
jgi:transcription elongation factor Elf1